MRGQGGVVGREGENEEARGEWRAPKSESFCETHLWSEGFSRDSGLKGAGEKVNGMQCKRKRPEGKKEGGKEGGRKDVVSPLGYSQRSGLNLELQEALLMCSTTISTMSTVDNNSCVIIGSV